SSWTFDFSFTESLKRYGRNIDPVVALSYVREINKTFVDQVEKYEMFLDVMKDLTARRLAT
ncbi:hypothetical protein H5410_030533, partial [Solanum commersonii]